MKTRAGLYWVAVGAALFSGAVQAHHPGSHATRQSDGRVKVDVVAVTSDSCTKVSGIRSGTPTGVTSPPDSAAITVLLQQEGRACAATVTAVKEEMILDVPRGATQIHLYFQAPDGSLASSERVPIQ